MVEWKIIISPSADYSYQEIIIEGPRSQESARQVVESRYPGAHISAIIRI